MKFSTMHPLIQKTLIALLSCLCLQAAYSIELAGNISDGVYHSADGFYTTRLPDLNGEIRDFPNAVSMFNIETGAQDSFEYFRIPASELTKYEESGAEDYHRQFIGVAFIDKRFKASFQDVTLASDGLVKIGDKDVFISALNMQASSQSEAGKFSGQQLRVLLGSVVEGEYMLIYQIAETADDIDDYKEFAERATKKLIIWLGSTSLNPAAKINQK